MHEEDLMDDNEEVVRNSNHSNGTFIGIIISLIILWVGFALYIIALRSSNPFTYQILGYGTYSIGAIFLGTLMIISSRKMPERMRIARSMIVLGGFAVLAFGSIMAFTLATHLW